MARLLEGFASNLSGAQKAEIETLLQEELAGSKISNLADFKTALDSLVEKSGNLSRPLTASEKNVTPLDQITSEYYNTLVKYIDNDLGVLFDRVQGFCDLSISHRELFSKKLTDLKNSLARLDTEISRYEILTTEPDYGLIDYNTFNTLKAGSYEYDTEIGKLLYVDPRSGALLSDSQISTVDVAAEGLTLPLSGETTKATITVVDVIEGNDTTESDLDMEPDDNSITNLYSDSDGKFWVHPIILVDQDEGGEKTTPPSDGVDLTVEFTLSGAQQINYITLSPVTDTSMTIESISYQDVDGNSYYILSTPQAITEKVTFTFSRVVAESIRVTASQKSYSEIADFYYSDTPEDIAEIQDLMDAGGVEGITVGSGGETDKYARGYFYTLGYDFVECGENSFQDLGIYVSSSPIVSTGRLKEVYATAAIENSLASNGNPLDAIEFYIAKLNYDSSGLFVSLERTPIPVSADSVTHEVLTLNNGVSKTRFFPTFNTVKVYQDFIELAVGTDYQLSVDGLNYYSTLTDLEAAAVGGPPPELRVKILTPIISSVYTTSYTAATDKDLNASQTAKLGSRAITYTYSSDESVSYSHLYMVIITRSLDFSFTRETPIVFDYTLLAQEETNESE